LKRESGRRRETQAAQRGGSFFQATRLPPGVRNDHQTEYPQCPLPDTHFLVENRKAPAGISSQNPVPYEDFNSEDEMNEFISAFAKEYFVD
jgi:hypothetical protein